jgi:hypothetical protein
MLGGNLGLTKKESDKRFWETRTTIAIRKETLAALRSLAERYDVSASETVSLLLDSAAKVDVDGLYLDRRRRQLEQSEE